jgi:hypothetical protein
MKGCYKIMIIKTHGKYNRSKNDLKLYLGVSAKCVLKLTRELNNMKVSVFYGKAAAVFYQKNSTVSYFIIGAEHYEKIGYNKTIYINETPLFLLKFNACYFFIDLFFFVA